MLPDRNDATAEALARAVEGQYRIEKEIGRGGMGVVFLAVDEQLQRHVAIKTLPPHLTEDAAIRARFLHEARTAGALAHPGIVPIYSAAEKGHVVYFVMRWIDGDSLADRLASQGRMSSDAVMSLLAELTHALGYAHAQGIVHRDIKAENVLIERKTGRAVITDFGIARIVEAQPMTVTGTVLGTVQYMSPEQVTGQAIDGRTDLYALGVLGFNALTGRFPFERPTPSAVLVAHVNDPPPKISWFNADVSPKADRIVSRLLEKQPAARFASADLLRKAIEDDSFDDSGSSANKAVLPSRSPLNALAKSDSDLATPSATAAVPDKLSSADAQRVWARAAELQAHTGTGIKAPTVLPANNAEEGAFLKTVGYDVTVVRDAARDAGIDVKYVERALLEQAGTARGVVVAGKHSSRKPGFFVGSHTRLDFESSIEGELTQNGFEEIADEARRSLGEMVQVSAVGRMLTITPMAVGSARNSPSQRQLQITVSSRNGRTSIQAFENLQQTSTATFSILMAAIGGPVGALVAGIWASSTGNPIVVLPGMSIPVLAGYLAARIGFKRHVKKCSTEVSDLLSRLIAIAGEHVDR